VGAALIHNAVHLYQFGVLHERLIALGQTPEAIREALVSGRSALPEGAAKTALVDLYSIYAVPMLGASGAIYGILVAFGLLYPNAKLMLMFIPVPIAAKIVIPVLLALDLLSGATGFSLFGGGIAHLGGALIGFLLMMFWRRRMMQPAVFQIHTDTHR
jgi:membrane associated rhomboid family serine protease